MRETWRLELLLNGRPWMQRETATKKTEFDENRRWRMDAMKDDDRDFYFAPI